MRLRDCVGEMEEVGGAVHVRAASVRKEISPRSSDQRGRRGGGGAKTERASRAIDRHPP